MLTSSNAYILVYLHRPLWLNHVTEKCVCEHDCMSMILHV
jgi:hypothetical protein